jgi:DNA polymerase-3 subunit epsilon
MNNNEQNQIDETRANLAFVDVETTGAFFNSELLEIGVVLVSQSDFKVIEEWTVKIKPQKIEAADPEALKVIGYNEEEWKWAIELKPALEQFLKKVENSIIIGHNISWDLMWLRKALSETGLSERFARRSFDVISIAYTKLRNQAPEIKYFSLSNLAKFFNIEEGQKHRALDDARTTYKVFLKLLEYE